MDVSLTDILTIRYFINEFEDLKKKVAILEEIITNLTQRDEKLMANFDVLRQEVEEAVGAQASAVVLITGLVAELKKVLEADTLDTAAIEELVTKLDTSTTALADAVVVNTPVAPVVEPTPVVEETPVVETPVVDPAPVVEETPVVDTPPVE